MLLFICGFIAGTVVTLLASFVGMIVKDIWQDDKNWPEAVTRQPPPRVGDRTILQHKRQAWRRDHG